MNTSVLTGLVQLAAITGAFVGLVTFAKGLIEYSKQNALKRAEYFFKLRERLKDDDSFKVICDLLDHELLDEDDERLVEIEFKDKRDFLGLFEEIAIAMNSELIRESVAHYMFGYYAIRCWESENFWRGVNQTIVNRESPYWQVFASFAQKMVSLEQSSQKTLHQLNTKNYRF